jgi:hypothetical protein
MTENTIPIPPLSDGTRAAIANLVNYTIEREYGQSADAEMAGAKTLAMGGLHFDLRDQFISINGTDEHLDGYVEATLRILLRDGLAERTCQCRTLYGVCPHTHNHSRPICANHTEADVPPIRGALLCGACHVDEYQTASSGQ